MDLDGESEEIMRSEEEMTRDKPSGASAANHNHYSSKFFFCLLYSLHLGKMGENSRIITVNLANFAAKGIFYKTRRKRDYTWRKAH